MILLESKGLYGFTSCITVALFACVSSSSRLVAPVVFVSKVFFLERCLHHRAISTQVLPDPVEPELLGSNAIVFVMHRAGAL